MINEPTIPSPQELAKLNQSLLEIAKSPAGTDGLEQGTMNLISQGADVNAVDPEGRTPLMLASRYGHREIVGVLLERGAKSSIEARDENNLTALIHAVVNGRQTITQDLIKAQANVNVASPEGFTPLMIASANDNVGIAQDLLVAKADINAANAAGDTSLILATQVGIISFLINEGADVNKENLAGKTALKYIAASNFSNRAEIVNAMFQSVLTSEKVTPESRTEFLGQLDEDIIRDNLNRETAQILAIVLPEEGPRNIVINAFNETQLPIKPSCLSFLFAFLGKAESDPMKGEIKQDVEGKTDMLRKVRSSLGEGLEELRKTQTSDITTPNTSEVLANSVIIDFVKNPEKLKTIRNYIQVTPMSSKISGPLGEQVIANTHLTTDQNYVLEHVLRSVLSSKDRSRKPSPNLDTENVSTAAVSQVIDDRGHST